MCFGVIKVPFGYQGFSESRLKKNPRNLESYPNELDFVGFWPLFGYHDSRDSKNPDKKISES